MKENAEKIRHTAEKYGDRVLVGCGTALTVQEVEAACDAGACLVISPNVDYGVIRRTRSARHGFHARRADPDGDRRGARRRRGYCETVSGGYARRGLHQSRARAAGLYRYVRRWRREAENVEQFLDAGVCGFGVGGQLVLASAVKSGDFAAIQARAKQFTDAIAAWNEKHS